MANQAMFGFLFLALLCGSAVATSIDHGSGAEHDGDHSEYFPHDDEEPNDVAGKLNMITITPEKIEGSYFSKNGGGVHFMSEVLSTKAELTIRTLEGYVLLTSQQYQQGLLLTVMGRQFLIVNSSTIERRELTGFVVPQTYSEQVNENLKTNHGISHKVLRNLDFDGANTTRQSAYEELLSRAEIDMIINAAQSLGKRGVMGSENPSAFSFYLLALQFSKFRPHESPELETDLEQRTKRSHCGWWSWDTHCSNGECCGTCPTGNGCHGLCGDGCNCWWWVCGNCCWNRFCEGHDDCCSEHGNSWGCLYPFQGILNLNALHIGCYLPYWCYSDAPVPDFLDYL